MAAPVNWLSAFQLNIGMADSGDNLFDPQIMGLSNGNFLVAWTEAGTAGVGAAAGNDIIGMILGATGNLVRAPFALNTSRTLNDEADFDIAATNDGGFMLVYLDTNLTTAGQETVMWERFDASGSNTASQQVATNSIAADILANPTIVVNNDTNDAYVTFTDELGGNSDIRAIRISASGTIISAEFDAAQNSADRDADSDTAININGELISIYEETSAGIVGIEMRAYSTAGALQHSVIVNTGPANDPHVATLTNGNVVAVWQGATSAQYRVYDSNLVALTGPLTVDASGDTHISPEIVSLPEGGFVVLWDNSTDNTLEARRFNADGSTDITDTVFVVEPPAGAEISPNIGVTADGRVLFVWEEGNDVEIAIWDTRGPLIDAASYTGLPLNFVETDVITGNAIDSTVTGDSGVDTIFGQNGNDVIAGGDSADVINGGSGADVIEGGLGIDTLDGGPGSDTFVIRDGELPDEIVGGIGVDALDLSSRALGSGANVNLRAGTYTVEGASNSVVGVETVFGTQLDDTLRAGADGDGLFGRAGNDLLVLRLGDGLPNFDGGAGTDTVDFSSFSDNISIDMGAGFYDVGSATGFANDGDFINIETYLGSSGIDNIIGNAASSLFTLGAGADTVLAGDGRDTVEGLGGDDFLDLGGGIDVGLGGGGNDTIDGGPAADDIQGGAGADVLNGGRGTDLIDGGSGGDTINGAGSNDTILGGNAADVIDGGDGNDLINGEGFTDTINGGANNDTISGGGSSDVLNGDGGSDVIFGNNGADTIAGGDGADSLNGGTLNDEIRGGTGNDTINGSTGDDRLYGGSGNDIFTFRANHGSFDRIFDFQDGNDLVQFNINSINDISDLTLTDVFSGVDIDYGTGLIRVLGLSSADFSNADFDFI